MAEELQESDVLWPKQSSRNQGEDRHYRSVFQDENVNPVEHNDSSDQLQKKKKKMMKGKSPHSLPVTIPCSSRANTSSYNNKNNNSLVDCLDSKEIDDNSEVAELVPPHLLVAGRSTQQMAFSVCSGNGRTLRGRDLSRLRDSILRMTGFIET